MPWQLWLLKGRTTKINWTLIWILLASAAVVFHAILLKGLVNRGLEVLHQLDRLGNKLASLQQPTTPFELPEPATEADTISLLRTRMQYLSEKRKKRAARQHKLIESITSIKIDEGRFK